MSRTTSEMQRQIDVLLEELLRLKEQTGEKLRALDSIQDSIGEFESRLAVHVAPLEERRDSLRQQLDDCRYSVEQAIVGLEGGELPDDLDVAAESDEFLEPFDPLETPAPLPEENVIGPSITLDDDVNLIVREKKQLHIFFAKRFHPDQASNISESDELMTDLNVAHGESEDVVDMLVQIPWHDGWLSRDKSESMGDQWMRLTSWIVWLREGGERLEQRLQNMQLSWNYASFEKWEQAGRPSSFFTSLASQLGDEIAQLQQEIDECQSELAEASRGDKHDNPT